MRPWTPVKIKIILINENEMTNKQEIWHSGLVNDYTINFIKFFNKQIKFLNKGVRFQTYLCQLNDFPSWAEKFTLNPNVFSLVSWKDNIDSISLPTAKDLSLG